MPCKLGITSMSLGRASAGHSLTHKLNMAYKYGYQGIELFYEDLVEEAATHFEPTPPSPSTDATQGGWPSRTAQLAAASHIRSLCAERHIAIICLQPLAHYEGLLDRGAHAEQIEKLHFWIRLAHELGTDMIQVPSSFLPAEQVSEDMGLIVSDLQELADIGAASSPPIRFVYESLCWGTRADLWETSWEIVRRVDRDNFGLCLDSFNIAGRIYADPTAETGKNEGAEEAVRQSMESLVRELRPNISKVFYVQIVDAERLSSPLVEGHAFYNAEQPARMSWSRNCRLFYGERQYGAYLPIRDIAETFFHRLGFEGWVSLELFNRRMGDEQKDVPEELAMRGALSWRKLVDDMKLEVDLPPALHVVSEPFRVSASL
ncbi:3-dehydroshikimate dehydratase [Cytospora mali]|uniref:3-dehydroshikimate dehydratase n=1 Tax=Cytospora mali TaxID=578113 RepID=A0A194W1W3_CYTMA|nr:3-dehydroshikimate dehydratase [Valsa mali]